ncbi:MAG: hypothetical protein ACLFRU_00065 [Paracoccaceae bacterium]
MDDRTGPAPHTAEKPAVPRRHEVHAGVLRTEGGYSNRDIVTFHGTDAAGLRTELAQHLSLLLAIPPVLPRRIGFRRAADLEEG